MSLQRDYTIQFLVDASQADPAFAAILRNLQAIQQEANQAAVGVNQLGQQMMNLPATVATTGQSVAQSGDWMKKSFLGINAELAITYAAFEALRIGADILQQIAERARAVRDAMKEAAEETAKFRQENRELANLQGKPSPDDEVTAGTLEFALKGVMTAPQALKYLEQYEGSSPAGRQKGNVGPEGATPEQVAKVEEEIKVAGARFGQRVNLAPKTAGDLAGVLTQYGRVESGEQASEQFGRIAYGLNEGRGNLEPLMRSYINTLGALVDEGYGPIKDRETAAAMFGVMSTHHAPDEAGTYLKKAVRELREFNGPQAEGLEKMGITKDMDAVEAIGRAQSFLAQQNEAPDIALQNLGFKDRAGIQALVEITNDWGLVQQRRENMEQITGESVEGANAQFFDRSTAGMQLRQASRDSVSKLNLGMDQEKADLAAKSAMTRMRTEKRLSSQELAVVDKFDEMLRLSDWTGAPNGMQERVNRERMEQLRREAVNVGLEKEYDQLARANAKTHTRYELGKPMTQQPSKYTDTTGAEQWDVDYDKAHNVFNDLADKIIERGGDPYGMRGRQLEMELNEKSRPQSEKDERERMKHPRPRDPDMPAPRPGIGGKPVPAGEPAPGVQLMSNDPTAGGGAGAGGGGGVEALLAQVVGELRNQTGLLHQQALDGPFGTHPDFGGGYTPGRA